MGGSLQVQHTMPIVWVWRFDREFADFFVFEKHHVVDLDGDKMCCSPGCRVR